MWCAILPKHHRRWTNLTNLNNKLVPLAVFMAITHVLLQINAIKPSFPHYKRMGRLVDNVDKYSKMLPLTGFEASSQFRNFVATLKNMPRPPYVIFFDLSNINVTLNHICNLQYFAGAVERLVAVSFDYEAERQLNAAAPHVPTVTIDFSVVRALLSPSLENRKYITYQLVLLLRSRVAAALASEGIDFWAMQQDSIWTTNFADMGVEERYSDAHVLFDTVGNDQFAIYDRMKGWICGSTFFVRGSQITADFFYKVTLLMRNRVSPDSAIMTYLCGANYYKCVKLPKHIVSSSNFFMGNRNETPAMIQIDHQSKLSKLDLFRENNFIFREDDGTCNATAVAHIRNSVYEALPEVKQAQTKDETSKLELFYYYMKESIGLDPFNNKRFLHVHETLV